MKEAGQARKDGCSPSQLDEGETLSAGHDGQAICVQSPSSLAFGNQKAYSTRKQ